MKQISHSDHVRSNLADQKTQIVNLLQRRDFEDAEFELRRIWRNAASTSLAAWVIRSFSEIRPDFCSLTRRVAFLRSFTAEPAVQLLQAAALGERIAIDTFVGKFDTYTQELLDPTSALSRFQPDVIFLCVLTRSIAPELWNAFGGLSATECDVVVNRVCREFSQMLDAFQAHHRGCLIVHTLEAPRFPMAGIADSGNLNGQTESVRRINRFLLENAAKIPGVSILDSDWLIREVGAAQWYDDARWESIRLPMTGHALQRVSNHWLRFVSATSPNLRKVLVCDLDNTLWHGVVGEDGYDGIEMGDSCAGASHRSLQRTILDLYHRGILLAICSKNNESDAWQVIERHPDMLLRPQHFAAVRINWLDKNVNLLSIADELNVGIESLVFLDDNPQEQLLVRRTLPHVRVLDVGTDAAEFVTALRNETGFECLRGSQEDRSRWRMYAAQRQRSAALQNADGLESYLHSLQIVVTRVSLDIRTIDRVAQLTQKTNQFNLTTKRYTSSQISAMTASSVSCVLAYRVKDRFGDSGIAGVAILLFSGESCEIDSFLISCRVIGRGIETAMLHDVISQVELRKCGGLIGKYLPTNKNAICADFYDQHGFVAEERDWHLNCAESGSVCLPTWITLQIDQLNFGSAS